jgi:hypothetical protein
MFSRSLLALALGLGALVPAACARPYDPIDPAARAEPEVTKPPPGAAPAGAPADGGTGDREDTGGRDASTAGCTTITLEPEIDADLSPDPRFFGDCVETPPQRGASRSPWIAITVEDAAAYRFAPTRENPLPFTRLAEVRSIRLVLARSVTCEGNGACTAVAGALRAHAMTTEWDESASYCQRTALGGDFWSAPGASAAGFDRSTRTLGRALVGVDERSVEIPLDPAELGKWIDAEGRLAIRVSAEGDGIFVAATRESLLFNPPALVVTSCPSR